MWERRDASKPTILSLRSYWNSEKQTFKKWRRKKDFVWRGNFRARNEEHIVEWAAELFSGVMRTQFLDPPLLSSKSGLVFKSLILIKVCFVCFQFVTSVVSCCPAELKQEVNGKKETLRGFNVKLQDTILFPEGGGQVCRLLKRFLQWAFSFESYAVLCYFSVARRSWAHRGGPSFEGEEARAGRLTLCGFAAGGGSGGASEGGLGQEVWSHAATLRWGAELKQRSAGNFQVNLDMK